MAGVPGPHALNTVVERIGMRIPIGQTSVIP